MLAYPWQKAGNIIIEIKSAGEKKGGRCDRSHSGHVDVDLKILENSG